MYLLGKIPSKSFPYSGTRRRKQDLSLLAFLFYHLLVGSISPWVDTNSARFAAQVTKVEYC